MTERGYSQRFRTHFLVPLTSALWSTAPEHALEFPAAYAIRFFDQHGMLGFGRHRWRTVDRRRRHATCERVLERLGDRVQLGLGVRSRCDAIADGVELRTDDDATRRFDAVVVATHGGRGAAAPRRSERRRARVLGAWRSTRNEVVLHTDARFLPARTAARASWNYQLNGSDEADRHLLPQRSAAARDRRALVRDAQPLGRDRRRAGRRALDLRAPALHGGEPPRPARAASALRARGGRTTPGAYHGNGFHEDGLASGVRAAAALGVTW